MSFFVGTGVPDCPDDKNIALDCFVQISLFDPAVKHMLRLRMLLQNSPIRGNCNHLTRNELVGCHQRTLDGVFKTAAARNLHAQDFDALDIVVRNDLRKLLGVVALIQLRTADQRDVVFHKVSMEIAVGVCCTVRRDQQICAIKVRCAHGNELDLTRPLEKL